MIMDSFRRQTAYLCSSKDIHEGEYVKQEGWSPNYVMSDAGVLARVRLIGIVIQEQERSILLDDGLGTIWLRYFDVKPNVTVGEAVQVIGRPRMYNDEMYVSIEILRALPSQDWLSFFTSKREEYKQFIPKDAPVSSRSEEESGDDVLVNEGDVGSSASDLKEGALESSSDVSDEGSQEVRAKNKSEQLIEVIRELDGGDGAPTQDVIEKAGFSDAEERLTTLIEEGEVFELRAGKIKVLE